MKRTLALLLACALGFGLLAGCSSGISDPCTGLPVPAPKELTVPRLPVIPLDNEEVNDALAGFGLELLKQTRTVNGMKALESEMDHVPFSTLVSPFSVAIALAMAANGAEGDTLSQFMDLLGGGVDLEALNGTYFSLIHDCLGGSGSTECSIANSLWVDPEGQIRDEFVGKCQDIYGAQVYEANLSTSRIVDDVNNWVSDYTNQMIPQIIDEPFSEDTALLLVNALYLKNQWAKEFDPRSTRQMDFHHAGGSDSQPDYLQHFDTKLSYMKGAGAQGVVLPYDDGRLAFVAILPDLYPDSPDLGEWLNHLEGDDLVQLIQNREDTLFLRFSMPKFEAEWKGNLEEILTKMGLYSAFIPGTANFSRMGSSEAGYYIGRVIHAAKIQVNEKGTEAAAATVVAANSGSAEPPQDGVTLILNRPFLYGIIDLWTGVPLFLGTYE